MCARSHPWRESRHSAKIFSRGCTIPIRELSGAFRNCIGVQDETLRSIIERAVRDTLERCDGNKSDAARRLGISRTRLQRLLAGQSRNNGASNDAEALSS